MNKFHKTRKTQQLILIGLGVSAIFLEQDIKRRRRIWMRSWLEKRHLGRGLLHLINNELRSNDIDAYKNVLRMPEEIFLQILRGIKSVIEKKNTNMRQSISARKRLTVTLRFLATGETFRSLMYSCRIHESTIGKIVMDVCNAIYSVFKNKYLKMPNSIEDWEAISSDFFELCGFPNCLGAIDGKHIAIRPPPKAGSTFFNYKGYHSIVLLAVADANHKFIYVDVGVNGRISDGGVYRESTLGKAIKNNSLNFPMTKKLPGTADIVPYVFLGDDAFSLSPRLMKPYPLRGLSPEQELFNYQLSRARGRVECSFGILANRFRVLMTTIGLKPSSVEKIVLAAAILHNMLTTQCGSEYVGGGNENCDLLNLNAQGPNKSASCPMSIRDAFKRYFVNSIKNVQV